MAKNTHLEHLEDDIVNQGKAGGFNAIKMLRELGKMLSEPNSSIRVTTKWDGAPAIVCGTDPITGYFFVGTKSVFNKTTPKIMYTQKQIFDSYDNQPAVAKILSYCLKYFPSLGISGVVQGDFLFTSESKSRKSIGGEECISFQPNTITYAVPIGTPMAKMVDKAKIGIVFHTRYSGDSLSEMSAIFGVPTINSTDDVAVFSSTFTDASDAAKMNQLESQKYNSAVNKADGSLKQASAFLNLITEQGEGRFMMNMLFKQYMNGLVRQGIEITDAQKTTLGFFQFYGEKLKEEIDAKKTVTAKTKYSKILADGLIFLAVNRRPLYFTVASYMNLISAKEMIISRLEKVKDIKTFLKTENGYEVTAPEGFVAISSGGALKLVKRREFSRANFTAAKDWENG
jgi:hypothetical protein